jgi:hypothetical protein
MGSPTQCRAPRTIANMAPTMTPGTNAMTKPEPNAPWPAVNPAEPQAGAGHGADGRFLAGNSGGGRRKGSRNKLSETFLETVSKDFAEHGADALKRLREFDPATYLKMIAWLIPREMILQRERSPDVDPADLTDAEVAELIGIEQRRQMILGALKSPR